MNDAFLFHLALDAQLAYNHRYETQIPEPVPSYPGMGLQLGIFGFFPRSKKIVICQVRMCCGLSPKINRRETLHLARRTWTYFVCVCFLVCGWQKPKYPQLELPGWQCHYTGWYRGSEISFLYLCLHLSAQALHRVP